MCRGPVDVLPCVTSAPHSDCVFHGRPARVCAMTACFSQITTHRFKYTSVRQCSIWISTLIFPQCSERISIGKSIREIHICILRIGKSRLFCCCQYSCYRHDGPSVLNSRQLSTPPSNTLNNLK